MHARKLNMTKTSAIPRSGTDFVDHTATEANSPMADALRSSEIVANDESYSHVDQFLAEPLDSDHPKTSHALVESHNSTMFSGPSDIDMEEAKRTHTPGPSRSEIVHQHPQPDGTAFGSTVLGRGEESDHASSQVHCGSHQTSFLSLPGELRMKIYKYIIDALPPSLDLNDNRRTAIVHYPGRKGFVVMLPELCYVNKQIYCETVSYILSQSWCEIVNEEDVEYFDNILQWLPPNMGYHSVKKVAFTDFSGAATSPSRAILLLDFLKLLPNLDTVYLTVELDRMHMPDQTPASRQLAFLSRTPNIKTGTQIAENYHLRALCELQRLQYIAVFCEWEDPIQPTPMTINAFFDVGDWLEDNLLHADHVEGTHKSQPFVDPHGLLAWAIRIRR